MTTPKNLQIDWNHTCDKPSARGLYIGYIYTCETCGHHWKVVKAPWGKDPTAKSWLRVALSDQDYH